MCFHIRMQYYLLIYRDLIMNLSFWALSISKALYTYGTIIIICSLSMMFPVIKPRRFFFSSRRRHTSSNCDWSSDLCSSDLADLRSRFNTQRWAIPKIHADTRELPRKPTLFSQTIHNVSLMAFSIRSCCEVLRRRKRLSREIGRASCRESV